MFKDKTILITGGTGYLGKALTKEILTYNPRSVRIFSRDEVKHHNFSEKFFSDERIRNLIGDVRDYNRLKKAFEGVDIVIHAAALKRLDLLEYNVEESIKTNVMGSLNVVDACFETPGIEHAIMISTDKACSPVNTYGACKFVSERIFTESNFSKGFKKVIFSTVRYGNVLESTGSVIPFFTKKILEGKPVPLTDERMTRFIISPKQATELIFKAVKHSVGGEVFVPRLPAFRITDLIELLSDKLGKKARIEKIGIRPGEKLHELMINSSEVERTYSFKDLYVITSCIAKYIDIDKVEYVSKGRKLSENEMYEYSSKDSVKSKDEVAKILEDLGVL